MNIYSGIRLEIFGDQFIQTILRTSREEKIQIENPLSNDYPRVCFTRIALSYLLCEK